MTHSTQYSSQAVVHSVVACLELFPNKLLAKARQGQALLQDVHSILGMLE